MICVYGVCSLRFSHYYFCGPYREEYQILPLFFFPISDAVAFIDQDAVLSQKETYMTEPQLLYALATLESPYILDVDEWGEEHYENYYFSIWDAEGSEECNYIIREGCYDYYEKIRAAGFEERQYDGYSLFYKK